MEISENIKPCLVQTPQGFSVSYKDKLLYSKYNPSRAVLQLIENTSILPGTLILCCSPVLDYGLLELQKKLPENCKLLRCEFDDILLSFEKEHTKIPEVSFLSIQELYNLPANIFKFGIYKRIIRLDFSAGTSFHQDLYNQLAEACTQSVLTWWANRLTLTKFGRKYSQNFFKNLKTLYKTTPIDCYIGKISKPIIVCGAGESLNNGIKEFEKNYKDYFILCADTALQPLLKHKIYPDGVFIEEAQHVITKAFLGTSKYDIQVFAGLSSINQVSHFINKKNISYFTTEYTDAAFIDNLNSQGLLPFKNSPFGSVGLTAVYYALQFRKDETIPVYIYGLDFSYSSGITHAKGALAHTSRLITNNRLIPVQNYGASFNKTSISVQSKDTKKAYTSPVMVNYAKLFNSLFEGEKELYDAADFGLYLNLSKKKPEPLDHSDSYSLIKETFSTTKTEKLNDYFKNEKTALEEIKKLLTGKIKLPAMELEAKITELVKPREYLYLHFADGWQFQYSQSFLNRIRTEIDFFLKIL